MKKNILLLLLSLSLNVCFSQSIKGFRLSDSLKGKSFEYLENTFDKTLKINSKKAEIYANSVLLKGKKGGNENKVAEGYLLLYKTTSDPLYLDSMIMISKKVQNFDNISRGYLQKGNYYYFKSDYSKSLENYLFARDFSKNNKDISHIINFNIGLLKLELDSYQESLKLFLDYKKYLEYNNLTVRKDYISCLYAIAYTYSKMDQLDLSDSFVKLGLEKNSLKNNKKNYSNLLLVSGINSYKRKQYDQAIKKLKNVSKLIKDHSYNAQNLALSEFYIGMSLYGSHNTHFLDKFKVVDSIIINTNDVTSELRDLYPILIEHYKKTNDKENQLLYIEHLLDVDSILNKSNHILYTELNKKYDTPILLKEKEKLISELDSKNSILFWITGIIGLILIVFLFLYYKNNKKIKYYQQQAILLTKNPEPIIIEKKSSIVDNKAPEKIKKEISKITLSEEILESLNLKFKQFEESKDFLNRNLTLDSLSKEFNTNRDYLSKAVNELKGKNFSQYINELRIKYIVEELKMNPKLQNLTIAGIAEEAAFNNSESFTNSFKKITGTLPSYYIKALKT
ncbi:helix-turn-helix transcriptional regulator [Chryseobacterium gotjawalense]|uniref:Helix-turn-helix transcriptional regulator n=1 Tax=Chryseobacterium gotjawalense TaxID=3042315 RepID=A0ABY8RDA5_9FLAO|nr:helix-turn-helix transcriptional regulator [Chryseobacterium sp. wdc7]WHF51940.1 helix-turn-helix transcriptional regulator [Chryseobacterium sp. wdc7]